MSTYNTHTVAGTGYTAISTTSVQSILADEAPRVAYCGFPTWIADVDRLHLELMGKGVLEFCDEDFLQEAFAAGIRPNAIYWHNARRQQQQSFDTWLADVDRLCAACLRRGALMFRSKEQFLTAYVAGIRPKEMYWCIDQEAACAESVR